MTTDRQRGTAQGQGLTGQEPLHAGRIDRPHPPDRASRPRGRPAHEPVPSRRSASLPIRSARPLIEQSEVVGIALQQAMPCRCDAPEQQAMPALIASSSGGRLRTRWLEVSAGAGGHRLESGRSGCGSTQALGLGHHLAGSVAAALASAGRSWPHEAAGQVAGAGMFPTLEPLRCELFVKSASPFGGPDWQGRVGAGDAHNSRIDRQIPADGEGQRHPCLPLAMFHGPVIQGEHGEAHHQGEAEQQQGCQRGRCWFQRCQPKPISGELNSSSGSW